MDHRDDTCCARGDVIGEGITCICSACVNATIARSDCESIARAEAFGADPLLTEWFMRRTAYINLKLLDSIHRGRPTISKRKLSFLQRRMKEYKKESSVL